jgi:TANFOR domain-containing protein
MKKLFLLAVLVSSVFVSAFSQTNLTVSITVNVIPPYSEDVLDLVRNPGRLQVTLRNNFFQEVNIRLLGTITGDNGVTVGTDPNYRPPVPINLKPYQTLLLTTREIELMFDRNHLNIQGLDTRNFDRGIDIPEGSYQICVQAFQYDGSQPLSQDFPLGCSAVFSIHAIQPPILVSPACDVDLNPLQPQNIVFSWTPAVGILPQDAVYTFRLVELPLSNVEPNAYIDVLQLPLNGFEQKNIKGTTFVYNATHPPLKRGKKYAWRVQVFDSKKLRSTRSNAKSPVCTFMYGKIEDNNVVSSPGNTATTQKITIELVDPANNSSVESEVAGGGGNVTLRWKMATRPPNNDFVDKYLVEVAEVPANTNAENALTKARNSGNLVAKMPVERYKDSFEDGIAFTPPLAIGSKLKIGSTYAWQVRGNQEAGDLNKFTSAVWVFTVAEGGFIDVSQVKEIYLNGFPIKINPDNALKESTANKFKASGSIRFFENGPECYVKCQNWKIRPILKDGVKRWVVTSGELSLDDPCVQKDLAKYLKIVNSDVPGEFKFNPTKAVFSANMNVKKEGPVYKVLYDGGSSNLYGQATWLTELSLNHETENGGTQATLKSRAGNISITYADKLNGSLLLEKEFLETSYNNFKFRFLADSYFAFKGLKCTMHLSGSVAAPDNRSDVDKDLVINFTDEQDLVFTANDLKYELPVDQKGLVSVALKAGTVHFSTKIGSGPIGNTGSNPNFQIGNAGVTLAGANCTQCFMASNYVLKAKLEGEVLEVELPNIHNTGTGFYSVEADKNFAKKKAKVGGLSALFTSGGIALKKSRLATFTAKGKIFVPFLNITGDVALLFTENDKPSGLISLPENYESLLVKNPSETQKLWLKCTYLEYRNGKVHITPQFKLECSDDKGISSNSYLSISDMVIRPDGTLANEQGLSGIDHFYIANQSYGKYRGFKYRFVDLRTAKTANGYKLDFKGQMVFTQNVSVAGYQNVAFEFERSIEPPPGFGALEPQGGYQFDDWAAAGEQGGPSPNDHSEADIPVEYAATSVTDIAIKDNGVEAKHDGPTGGFGGSFTFYLGNDEFGNGFKLEAECTVKEPSEGKVKAIVMIGKAPAGFTYWFFEAGQQDVVTFPLFANIEAYGFKGRVYYHMKHKEGSGYITENNYVPSNQIGLGVFAELNISTNEGGKILWGTVALEITTTGSGGLNDVHLFGDAQILCEYGKGTNGQLHGIFNSYYDFVNDEFLAAVQVTGGVYNTFCINGTADLEMYMGPGDGNWHLYFGSKTPTGWKHAAANALCSDFGPSARAYLFIDSDGLRIGAALDYDSGWKGVSLGDWAGVAGRFTAWFGVDGSIVLSPFNIKATVSAGGSVMGKGCLVLCYEESASLEAALTFSAPNPVCMAGTVTIDVPVIPTFTVGARFKDGSFSFDSTCD